MPQLEASWFFFSFISQVALYFSAVQENYFFETQFLGIITFFAYLICDFNVSQRYHELFSCFKKGKTENNKWNTRWSSRGPNIRKMLFAGSMDIRCCNSHMAQSSDEFSPTFPLSGRILCTFISDNRKLVKECQKINTEHLNSS